MLWKVFFKNCCKIIRAVFFPGLLKKAITSVPSRFFQDCFKEFKEIRQETPYELLQDFYFKSFYRWFLMFRDNSRQSNETNCRCYFSNNSFTNFLRDYSKNYYRNTSIFYPTSYSIYQVWISFGLSFPIIKSQ